jgi:hypothetical protein
MSTKHKIQLSDTWHINVGPRGYDYELVEEYDTFHPRTKEATIGTRKSYFPSLQQCVNKLMKQESLEAIEAAENLKEVVEMLDKAEEHILHGMTKVYP